MIVRSKNDLDKQRRWKTPEYEPYEDDVNGTIKAAVERDDYDEDAYDVYVTQTEQ